MPNSLLVLVASVALIVPSLPRAEARPPAPIANPELTGSGVIRTDRLSRKQLKAWRRIVKIVMAEDRRGRPLHPTLRQLWDAVDSSHHIVYVEMRGVVSGTGVAGELGIELSLVGNFP